MVRLIVVGLILSVVSFSLQAEVLTNATVSGGSFFIGEPVLEPSGGIQLHTLTLESTRIDFMKEAGELVFPLTLFQIDVNDLDWQGLSFSLVDAYFSAVPYQPFSGIEGMIVGPDNSRAKLLSPPLGPFVTSNLEITFGGGTTAALIVTPIVPEPTTGAAVLATVMLQIGRRGRG